MGTYKEYEGTLDATGMRVAIVAGRFNDHVTKPLLVGALDTLAELGLDDVPVHWVPGRVRDPADRAAPGPVVRRGDLPGRGHPRRDRALRLRRR